MDRQFHVGTACRRLRGRGYRVQISAFGPQLDDETRAAIAKHVDSLIAQIGGVTAVQVICRSIAGTGNVHDGIWLLANRPGGYDRAPEPALPIGWLLALALRHIHAQPSTSDPTDAWRLAAQLATDFAAVMDCQRYNPYDGLNVGPYDFLQALEQSLAWRELFTLPQVPSVALTTIRLAFSLIAWPDGTDQLRHDVDRLLVELQELIARLSADCLTTVTASDARSAFPRLWRHARGPRGEINADYLDPFGGRPCNHDRFVFFEPDDDHALVLPPALTAAAGCVAVFTLIRDRAQDADAGDIVGDTIQKAVAVACRAHTDCVHEQLVYREGKTPLDIDVAVREHQQLVLFEAKSKSLTSKARTGDMMAFLFDYTNSFLASVRQLIRHEHNIKRGVTTLTQDEDEIDSLRITKVAVSPLCYGPSSDHVQVGALFRAVIQTRLGSVTGNVQHVEILDGFNKKLDQIARDLENFAPDADGGLDLFGYLIDLFWLDLGQLLYALHRGRSVFDSLSALRNLTFGTQDFWTEAAFADRRGLSERNWYPVTPAEDPLSDSGRRQNCR